MKILLFTALLFFSPMSFAERIVVIGEPVVLEERNDIYFLPTAYMPTTPYTYVTIRGLPRVCYPDRQPFLSHLDTVIINVEVEDNRIEVWNCYLYSATYFEERP